jgi:hypothetical protein
MIHDAAGIGRSLIHDAAGIGRSTIHDAAGIGRSMIHDAMGGPRHHPCDARHEPFMGSCHRRDIIGAMTRTDRHHATIHRHRSTRRLKHPQVPRSVGRFIRGGS